MRTRTFALPLGLASILSIMMGCAVGGTDDEWQTDVADTTLHLDEATPERLRGTFSRNGATIAFEASSLGGGRRTLVVLGSDGRTLVRAMGDGSSRTLSVMDARVSYSLAPASGAAIAKKAEVVDRLVTSGDDGALSDLFASHEGAALPWLSRELGKRGISGRAYPSSFELHSLALLVGKARETSLPPLEAAPGGATTLRSETCVNAPGRDACFGMCGNGCSCWPWVCGDCCWHGGCAAHDSDCRSCSFTHPGACARCASFAGFFSGGGCDGE